MPSDYLRGAMTQRPGIFISDNIISHRAQGGVTRFFRHLAAGIVDAYGAQTLIYSPEPPAFPQARYLRAPGVPGRVHDLSASVLAAFYRPKIFLASYYGYAFSSARHVYPVYDMIHELFPQYFPQVTSYDRRFVAEKRRCLHAGDLLIAISESTARDIVRIYPSIAPGCIVVARPGVDGCFFARPPWPGAPLQRPYLLYVGQRSGYKNFRRLLSAFGEAGLAATHDLWVISAEHGGFTAEERAIIVRYGLEPAIQHQLRVSDAELIAHYTHAVALVYPSEYEGFGLPIIEAMAAGTLVATSDRSSMPEIGGDVALYFDPTEVNSIAATLLRLAALAPDERGRRVAAGEARAHLFSWPSFHQKIRQALEPLLA